MPALQEPGTTPAPPCSGTARQGAGFTTGTPWIMVNPNYTSLNAAEQLAPAPTRSFTFTRP